MTATKVSASIAKKCIVKRLGIMPLKVGDLVRLKKGGPAMTCRDLHVDRRGSSPRPVQRIDPAEGRREARQAGTFWGVSDRSKNASGSDH